MTRDEISNMEAGEGIDLLIANHVMGFVDGKERGMYSDGSGWWTSTFIPHYSTDIEMAWEVVDKVYIHTLRRIVNDEPDHPALWQAFIYADSALSGIGETAPLAICRAALMAVFNV